MLRENGPMTKYDLADKMNISIPTVTSNVNRLVKDGLIQEIGVADAEYGRKPILFDINYDQYFSIGLDIQEHSIYYGLMNLKLEMIQEGRMLHTKEGLCEDIKKIVQNILEHYNLRHENIIGIGISYPGFVEEEKLLLKKGPNINISNLSLENLTEELAMDIYVGNEARLAAFAESIIGVSKEYMNSIYISIKEGIGAGIILDKRYYSGSTELAGEIGHIVVKKDGKLCNCGNRGCIEAYISINSLIDSFNAISDRKVNNLDELLGMFDECEYDKISYLENDSKEHHEIALMAARKSVVLLKNDGILPLDKNKIKTIAVIGPNANSREILKANYCGTASKYITLLEGIQNSVSEETRVLYSEGCHLFKDRVEPLALPNDRISEAKAIARLSDVVILCLGLDANLEGEEGDTGNSYAAGDKLDLNLPGLQQMLLEEIIKIGKPVILLLSSGSALAIDYAHEHCNAILQTWYPGALGGQAVAELLFGKYSPSGKLPITFYSQKNKLPDFSDYSMKNRTYRYIEEEPLYPFGYGLTYGKVELSNLKVDKVQIRENDIITISVDVENQSDWELEEVIQVYAKVTGTEYEVLNHKLCAFKRIKLEKAEKRTVSLELKAENIKVVDYHGNRIFDGDKVILFVGTSQPDKRSKALTGQEVCQIELPLLK